MNDFENELISCCQEHCITKKGQNVIEAEGTFIFPHSFTGFQGHFPDHPVLPAVIQMTMIRLLAEQTLALRLVPQKYGKTKFRRVVQPEQNIITKINLTSDEQGVNCKYKLLQPDGQLISEGSCFFKYF